MTIELEFQDCIVCGLPVATFSGSKFPACASHSYEEVKDAKDLATAREELEIVRIVPEDIFVAEEPEEVKVTPMIEVTICNEWDTGYLDEDSHKVRVKTFCEKDVLAAMREREWQNTFPGRRYFAVTKIAGKLKGIIIEAGEGDYV